MRMTSISENTTLNWKEIFEVGNIVGFVKWYRLNWAGQMDPCTQFLKIICKVVKVLGDVLRWINGFQAYFRDIKSKAKYLGVYLLKG